MLCAGSGRGHGVHGRAHGPLHSACKCVCIMGYRGKMRGYIQAS